MSIAIIVAFVAVLALWAGGSGDGDGSDALPAAPSTTATPVGPGGSSSPTPSGSTSAGTLPALPGFGSVPNGPNRTDLTTLAPGKHRIVITARSDKPMLAAAYSVRGESQGKIFYNVKSPVIIERTLEGGQPFAAVVLQVTNDATSGSCSITIDGKVADSRSTTKPYAVIGCSA